jgi:hypothetical protein
MRTVLMSTVVIFSATLFSGNATASGAPSLPCYVDGKPIGTVIVTDCKRQGGTVSKDRAKR